MSGKSSVASALSARLRRPVISTDDLGAAVRALVPARTAPDLHAFFTPDHHLYYARTPVAVQLEQAIAAHTALWPAIKAVAGVHASWGAPAIIEGWALLPELVAESFPEAAAWLSVPPPVFLERARADHAFYAEADDPETLLARFCERSTRFSSLLRASAQRLGLPFLELRGTEFPEEIAEKLLTSVFAESAP
jgi:2-phosphoglycerate kinase